MTWPPTVSRHDYVITRHGYYDVSNDPVSRGPIPLINTSRFDGTNSVSEPSLLSLEGILSLIRILFRGELYRIFLSS